MSRKTTSNKIAIKAAGKDYESFHQLVAAGLGGKEVHSECGMAALQLPDGTLVELYTPHADYAEVLFGNNKMIVSFKVNNLEEVVNGACSHGFKNVTEIIKVNNELRICYLQSDNGLVVGLYTEGKNASL